MAQVFVTRPIPGQALASLKAKHQVTIFEHPDKRKINRQELLDAVKGANAILSLLTETIDAEVMDAAGPDLKIIANYAVGFDNIDLEAAKARGIFVTNTPGNLGDAVAEFAITLMLSLSRQILAADAFTRQGGYRVWDPMIFLGQDLTGKTLGIIGAGTIGSVVARRAKALFEMPILYSGRSRKPDFESETGATFVDQAVLLKESDVISLHVPLTKETHHLLSHEAFSQMKSTALVINTARGPVIDEAALVDALKNNRIAGAGLDVYEEEVQDSAAQLNPEDWQYLIHSRNVILTPHIASATLQAREEMTQMVVASIMAALDGQEPPCLVPGCR